MNWPKMVLDAKRATKKHSVCVLAYICSLRHTHTTKEPNRMMKRGWTKWNYKLLHKPKQQEINPFCRWMCFLFSTSISKTNDFRTYNRNSFTEKKDEKKLNKEIQKKKTVRQCCCVVTDQAHKHRAIYLLFGILCQ